MKSNCILQVRLGSTDYDPLVVRVHLYCKTHQSNALMQHLSTDLPWTLKLNVEQIGDVIDEILKHTQIDCRYGIVFASVLSYIRFALEKESKKNKLVLGS